MEDGGYLAAPDGTPSSYSLGEPASSVYDILAKYRQGVIDRSREMAELTIPSLIPPDGWKVGDRIPGNNQSLGAHCVNTLAASLLFMAFPPNQPIMKLEPIEYEVQQQVQQDPELWANMEVALSRLAESHRQCLVFTTMLMTAYNLLMKYLLVAGNGLWRWINLDAPTVHDPRDYVCQRDSEGNPILSILKECVSVQKLPPDLREIIYRQSPQIKDQPLWEQTADIYSVCNLCREGDGPDDYCWYYWQEYMGEMLPGTEVETDYDNPPMYPCWMIPVYGQDWGRSYCEEYGGDLFSAEALSSATLDGASLAALSLLFVDPAGRTSVKQIREARNLSVLSGKADSLSVFRSDKGGDFQFVLSVLDQVNKRLGQAFLLNFTIQRSGERVTAEEIKRLGSELDKALGGLYTELAQRTQRPVILRGVHLNESVHPKMPKLPTGIVSVQVVTGVDALGNSKDAQDLEDLAGTVSKFFPTQAATILNAMGWALRYAAAKGIKPTGVIATDQQVAAIKQTQQQQAMKQTLMEKGTGPAVKGMMDGAVQNGLPAPPPQPNGPPPPPTPNT